MTAAIRAIQRLVAEHFSLTPGEMLANNRTRVRVLPRQLAMALAREQGLWSLPILARAFRRDHTTVMYALRRIHAAEVAGVAQVCGPLAELRRRVRHLPEVSEAHVRDEREKAERAAAKLVPYAGQEARHAA